MYAANNLDWKAQFMYAALTVNYTLSVKFLYSDTKNETKYMYHFLKQNTCRIFCSCHRITMLKTKHHDVVPIYLILYQGAEFMYVLMQIALLCYDASIPRSGGLLLFTCLSS